MAEENQLHLKGMALIKLQKQIKPLSYRRWTLPEFTDPVCYILILLHCKLSFFIFYKVRLIKHNKESFLEIPYH